MVGEKEVETLLNANDFRPTFNILRSVLEANSFLILKNMNWLEKCQLKCFLTDHPIIDITELDVMKSFE